MLPESGLALPHDLRFSEAQLLAAIQLPMLMTDEANNILFANEAAEAFFGKSKRRIIGEQIGALLHFASERLMRAILAGESDISAQNMRLLNRLRRKRSRR